MRKNILRKDCFPCLLAALWLFFSLIFLTKITSEAAGGADRRLAILNWAIDLEKLATAMAEDTFQYFKGRSGLITEKEQAILFKAEAFAASCRLFIRLTEERTGYLPNQYLRTNLFQAFIYLARSFYELEREMRAAGIAPFALSDCRRLLDRLDREFSSWPAEDNLAYLHQKYIKGANQTVYLIERRGPGLYVRHAFKNLESLYRYNYNQKRGKDPWKYLAVVSEEILSSLPEGEMIDLNFEGCLVMEIGSGPNRPVYFIDKGKKRPLTSPQVLERLGGWSKVMEVPAEILKNYPEGEPIN